MAVLKAEGSILLDEAARKRIDAHHAVLAATLDQYFGIDIGGALQRLSLGMRIASLSGVLAVSAARW